MVDEIYDVFDEKGNKVRTATWTEVHTLGLLHHTASILIFKDASRRELLIQKRSATVAQHAGLLQHSAGGHILAGDSTEKGMRRELQEELFFDHPLPDLSLTKIVTFFNQDMPTNREFLTLFETIYPGPFFYGPNEVAQPPHWVNWGDLLQDVKKEPDKYSPAFRKILEVYAAPSRYADAPQF